MARGTDSETDPVDISDAELIELALATHPDDVEFDSDAVPFGLMSGEAGLLPEWYMPAPMSSSSSVAGGQRRRRAWIVGGLVASMVIVNGFGLCVTYGIPEVGDRIVPFW